MPRLRTLLAALSAAAIVACDAGPSAVDVDVEPSFARGGGGALKVDATDPTYAPQDTTLDVSVQGSGFEPGAVAAFLLGGAPTPGVTTNQTTFVSDTELTANITVSFDAAIDLYDVEVSVPGGRRRGIGTELFAVVEKGGGAPSDMEPLQVELVSEVRPGVANQISGDGLGLYVHDECAVRAEAGNSLWFRPVHGHLSKREERDLAASGCGFPRSASWDLSAAIVHLPADSIEHDSDVLLVDYAGADPLEVDSGHMGNTSLGQWGDWSGNHDGIFNLRYCSDDGVGPPVRFIADGVPGTSWLDVSEAGGVVDVRTQPYPNNVGWCLHTRSDGTEVELLLHVDVAYRVLPMP